MCKGSHSFMSKYLKRPCSAVPSFLLKSYQDVLVDKKSIATCCTNMPSHSSPIVFFKLTFLLHVLYEPDIKSHILLFWIVRYLSVFTVFCNVALWRNVQSPNSGLIFLHARFEVVAVNFSCLMRCDSISFGKEFPKYWQKFECPGLLTQWHSIYPRRYESSNFYILIR